MESKQFQDSISLTVSKLEKTIQLFSKDIYNIKNDVSTFKQTLDLNHINNNQKFDALNL